MQARSDERFEEMREESNRRFEEMHEAVVAMQAEIGDVSSRYGKRAEDAARKLLARVLEAEGVRTAQIKHIQLRDDDGRVFPPGYTTDIDIYYEGKETWVIEYKARARHEDIVHLYFVGQLLREEYHRIPDRLLLVVLRISDEDAALAEKMGIEVLKGVSANPFLELPPDK